MPFSRHSLLTALGPLAALAALALTAASPARAQSGGLILSLTPSSAATGGSGAFDVLLTDAGASSFNVAGFSFQIAVDSASGVTFTSADTGTTAASYVFGTYQSGPFPFSFDAFPNTGFIASDADFDAPYTTLNPGDTFGLGEIHYDVAPGTAPGPVAVSFEDLGGGTSLSDDQGNSLDFTATDGQIQVTSASSAVPEPSSWAAFAFTGLGVAGLMLRARKRRTLA